MRWAILGLIAAMSMGAGPIGAVPSTQPAGKKHLLGAERTIHAMVAGVQGNVLRVSVLRKKAQVKERSIRVGKKTTITLNQQPVSLSALKAGENVTIRLNHGVAIRIDATAK